MPDLQTILQGVLVVITIILVILGLIIGYKKLESKPPKKSIIDKLNTLTEKQLLITLIMLRDPDEEDLKPIWDKIQ